MNENHRGEENSISFNSDKLGYFATDANVNYSIKMFTIGIIIDNIFNRQ